MSKLQLISELSSIFTNIYIKEMIELQCNFSWMKGNNTWMHAMSVLMKAFWRLCQCEIHVQVSAVVALPVHLPGHHTVRYDVNMDAQTIAERADASQIMLMAFFQSNTQNNPDMPKYLYVKYPEYYVWQKKEHVWTP